MARPVRLQAARKSAARTAMGAVRITPILSAQAKKEREAAEAATAADADKAAELQGEEEAKRAAEADAARKRHEEQGAKDAEAAVALNAEREAAEKVPSHSLHASRPAQQHFSCAYLVARTALASASCRRRRGLRLKHSLSVPPRCPASPSGREGGRRVQRRGTQEDGGSSESCAREIFADL